jgi:hypothetical protein
MGRINMPLAGDLTLLFYLKTAGRTVRRVAAGGKPPYTTHPKPGRETPVCRYPSAGDRLRHLPHDFLGVCYIIYIYVRDKSQNTGPIRSDRRVSWSCIYIGIKKKQNHPESRRQGRDPKNGWRGTDRVEMYTLYIYTIYVDTKTGHRTTPGTNHQPGFRDTKWPWPKKKQNLFT